MHYSVLQKIMHFCSEKNTLFIEMPKTVKEKSFFEKTEKILRKVDVFPGLIPTFTIIITSKNKIYWGVFKKMRVPQ